MAKKSSDEEDGGRKNTLPPILLQQNSGKRHKKNQGNGNGNGNGGNNDSGSLEAAIGEEYNPLEQLLDGDVSRETLATRTELNEEQIYVFSAGRSIADYYGMKGLDDLIDHLLRFNISKGRKSRIEFVKAFQMANNGHDVQGGFLSDVMQRMGR